MLINLIKGYISMAKIRVKELFNKDDKHDTHMMSMLSDNCLDSITTPNIYPVYGIYSKVKTMHRNILNYEKDILNAKLRFTVMEALDVGSTAIKISDFKIFRILNECLYSSLDDDTYFSDMENFLSREELINDTKEIESNLTIKNIYFLLIGIFNIILDIYKEVNKVK